MLASAFLTLARGDQNIAEKLAEAAIESFKFTAQFSGEAGDGCVTGAGGFLQTGGASHRGSCDKLNR